MRSNKIPQLPKKLREIVHKLISFANGGGLVLKLDGLVLWYESLHDAPADEVGNGTDAEHHHVGSGLALEAEELEVGTLSSSPVEELTASEVDAHRADTASHCAQTNDGTDGRLGEHVADGREEVGTPSLMTSTEQTNQNGWPPSAVGSHRLGKQTQYREAGKDKHSAHAAQMA